MDDTTTVIEPVITGDVPPADATPAPATLLSDAAPAGDKPIEPPKPFQWADEKGALTEGWLEKLTNPELRANKSLAGHKTVDSLVEAFVARDKLVGVKMSMPKADDPAEKWENWRKITGAPAEPVGYGDLRPAEVPKELWDVGAQAEAQAIAYKWGIPPEALRELAGSQAKSILTQTAQLNAREEQMIAAGKAELQQAFGDDYLRQMHQAKTTAIAMGFDPEDPADRAFFLHPKAIQNFARAYQAGFAGDKKVDGSPVGMGAGIDDQIEQVRQSPAYRNKEGPERQAQAQKFLHQLFAAKSAAQKSA